MTTSPQEIVLPNVRKLLLADPGYTLYDCDLAGADAQVVAWEAEDEDLKAAFRSGLKIHIKNVRDMFPDKVRGWSDEAIKATGYQLGLYDSNKKAVHLTNYGGTPRAICMALGWLSVEAERFQQRWFGLHPGIRNKFHAGVKLDLQTSRTVRNKFGFHRVYFDRIDDCFTEALAWKPQSTVALTTYYGYFQLEAQFPHVELLIQDHDDLVFQFPTPRCPPDEAIIKSLRVQIPYDDPLTISWALSKSTVSWGDCE